MNTDVLVIGGGLAGLSAALAAGEEGANVLLACGEELCGGSSFYPGMEQVACQAAFGTPAEDDLFLSEMLDSAQGVGDEGLMRFYIENINQAIERMPRIGIDSPRRTDTKIACFAKTARPTYAWGGWEEIRGKARARLPATVWENARCLGVIEKDGLARGAVFETREGIKTVSAGAVIMATGGLSGLYEHCLGRKSVRGDGQLFALRAGASLVNMEFLQFIPGFLSPGYQIVFRETSISYIDALTDLEGRDLLPFIPPDSLRLRAAYGPFSARAGGAPFDIAINAGARVSYKKAIGTDNNPFIGPYVSWLMQEKGIDLTKQSVCIAPFFHAANGGIRIDREGRTDVPGLYACGECAGGMHGADRQGGTSTGAAMVFGYSAGRSAARFSRDADRRSLSDDDAKAYLTRYPIADGDHGKLMAKYAGVVRDEKGLNAALSELPDTAVMERALLMCMLARRESRGAHYRADFPHADARTARYLIKLREGKCSVCLESSSSVRAASP